MEARYDNMVLLGEFEQSSNLSLRAQARQLQATAKQFYKDLDFYFLQEQITEVLETYYDLGKVVDMHEIFGGFENRSFGVSCLKDGRITEYFVRKYKKFATENEICFEHALVEYAIDNGFTMAAGFYPTIDGNSYVKMKEPQNGDMLTRFFAVSRYLPGEQTYTWVRTRCPESVHFTFGQALGLFHRAAYGFDPGSFNRLEPRTLELMPARAEYFRQIAAKNLKFEFHYFFLDHLDYYLNLLEQNMISPEEAADMPVCPIHCDYHLGNVKVRDGVVIGMFDFDWTKIDLRLFDVCLALIMACASWDTYEDGEMWLDRCRLLLQGYHGALDAVEEGGGPPPFTDLEKRYFTKLMVLANLYLINWEVRAFHGGLDEGLNDFEYLAYLSHQTRVMHWMEDHRAALAQLISSF